MDEALRADIDTLIAAYLPQFTDMQTKHFAERMLYWQGLWTHTDIPLGVDTPPTLAGGHPTDTTLGWGPATVSRADGSTWSWPGLALPAGRTGIPMRIRVDAYDGPSGPGWVAFVQTSNSVAIWERALNVGPETWRDRPWTDVTPTGGAL